MTQVTRRAVAKTSRRAERATSRLCARVRELRQARGWTLQQLADASGVSRSMLSQIERNETNPTFQVAYCIAQAFDISLGELADVPEPGAEIDVIASEDEAYHFRDDADCSLRTLFPLHLAKDVEFYELKLRPGRALESKPHVEGTREFVTVQKGSVRIRSGAHQADLGRSDSAHYRADVAHAVQNIGRGEAVVFLVAVYQRRPPGTG